MNVAYFPAAPSLCVDDSPIANSQKVLASGITYTYECIDEDSDSRVNFGSLHCVQVESK